MENATDKSEITKANLENLTNFLLYKDSLENYDLALITTLDLSNCALQNVPLALKDLPIRILNLSHNQLGEIPHCLFMGLENLKTLNLSFNRIPTFEIEPNCYETLEILNISNNVFKNVPQWIMSLRAKNLKELIYDFNKVTHLRCIFNNTSCFPVLKLSMVNCILRQEDCKFFKNCRNLQELDLSNSNSSLIMNMFENIEELFVQPNWKEISVLRLNNLSISIFPEGITWLETLTELYLSKNDFMWLPKDGFEFFVNLEILDLSHNSLYSLPDKLTWLVHLKVLKLNNNKLEVLPDFSTMKSLETLDLYYNKLCEFDCNMERTNLKRIDLECNFFDTECCDFLNYNVMKDNLRELLKDERYNGPRVADLPEFDRSDWSSDSNAEELEYCTTHIDEDWDEEIELYTRQVDVTPSDDEWLGYEELVVQRKEIKPIIWNPCILNEDVIFCDAD